MESTRLARFGYELSARAVEEQARAVAELRDRTGTLLAASSLATSFLGSRALDRGTSVAAVVATAVFVASIAATVYVLAPRNALAVGLRGTIVDHVLDEREAYRLASDWLDDERRANRRTVARLERGFAVATVGVTCDVILWVVALLILMTAPEKTPDTPRPVPPVREEFIIREADKGWFFAPLVNVWRRLRRKA